MQFELTSDFKLQLKELIANVDDKGVMALLQDLHEADIAEILDAIKIEDAKYIYSLLDEQLAADVIVEVEDDVREELLGNLTSKEIAEQVDNMESDDATDVIAELPEEQQQEVLSQLEDSEQASDIVDLLNYEEDTAGGIMATELISVSESLTAADCINVIRTKADEIEDVYAIYVVNEKEELMGTLPLTKLVTCAGSTEINNIYDTKVKSVTTSEDVEEVANIMDKYDMVVMPVVDQLGRLVGRITIDDIVDVRREEETEDVQKMGAVEALEESYIHMSIGNILQKRIGWLVILFLGETLTASAMSFFENELAKVVILALFVPLIISSGGNTGSQASTLIIRSLALGEITVKSWWKIIKRELSVGAILGLTLGIIGFLRVVIWAQYTDLYGPNYMTIGYVVGVSLVGVVLWGNIVGSLFPLVLKRLGFDPAVSSAPFVATLVDVTGLIIYFSVASLLLSSVLI